VVAQAAELGLSQRKACSLTGIALHSRVHGAARSGRAAHDKPCGDKDRYPRFGIRRAHALLRAGGQAINRKGVERFWSGIDLQVP